jgi:WD40 repeat protein
MNEPTPNPYVGPRPFERKDSARFFGRDQEARELLSLIVANRMVVLYAQSGAGKTSLLNAQVAPLLEAEGFELWPFARVHGPEPVNLAPADITNIYAFQAIFSWAFADKEAAANQHVAQTSPEPHLAALSNLTLANFLGQYPHLQDETGYERPRVLIFDQFEELFSAYPARWQERESFLNQIARALDNDPLLRVVFSLREDYLAQLDPYAHLLPRNLGVRFRLERMRPGAALAAIRGPLRETERNFAPEAAERLVEDLRTVRTETLSGETQTVTGEFVEPVQLQVVCQNLWEDLPDEVTTITAEHLRQFGNVDQALSNFYTRAVNRALPLAGVDEEELRQWFEASLITPASTRGTVYRGTRTTAGIQNAAVETLEDMHIIRGEIRAGSRWYELTHDRLIEPIQQANRLWHDARQAERIKRIRQIVIVLLVIVGLAGLGIPLLSLIFSTGADPEASEVRTTATAFAAAVEVAATEVFGTATAQEVMAADSQGTVAALAETSTALAPANETATAAIATATTETMMRDTAVAQTAVYQEALNSTATAEVIMLTTALAETAVAQQTVDAAVALAAVQATQTAEELERVRVPVRPLQPGISIGNQNSATAGTLSAFVVDAQGVYYLLGPNLALGAADAPILQPSPIDGGKPEDAVAFTARRIPLADLSTIDASLFINLAWLEPGISFQTTVPGIGPIVGMVEPALGEEVWVYGRTSGLVEREIICVNECPIVTSDGVTILADFTLNMPLSSGDEGALVIERGGYAVGIVATNMADQALGASMTAVLDQFDVELVIFGQQVAEYNLGRGVWPVAISPDGRQLASTSLQGIYLFDLAETDAAPKLLQGYDGQTLALAYAPEGRLLASGGQDNVVRLWDLSSDGVAPVLLEGHNNDVTAVRFTPDGQWVASASLDGTVRLWDVAGGNESIVVARLPHSIYDMKISADGRWLATGNGDGSVRLWDMADLNARPVILAGHENIVTTVDISSNGDRLVSAGFDGDVLIWDITSPQNGPTLVSEDGGRTVAFSPDGNWLASAGAGGTIQLWRMSNLEEEPYFLYGHSDVVPAMLFSPNGVWLASSSTDGTVRLWLVR